MGTWGLIGIYWRMHTYALRPFWTDESEQISVLSGSLRGICRYLRNIPGGFPGDYILTWPFIYSSTNKWVMTVPHLAFMFLAFLFLFLICQAELLAVWSQFLVLGLFSANRNLIFHALEIRPYAVLPALALMIYWYGRICFQNRTLALRHVIGWGLLLFLTLLFHSYGILMVASLLGYLLLFLRDDVIHQSRISRILISSTVGSLLALPLWLYFSAPSANVNNNYDVFQFVGHSAKGLFSSIFGNLGDVGIRWAWLFPLFLIVVSFFFPDKHRSRRIGYFGLIILGPLALILLGDLRTHYWFLPRQFVWLIPFWAILAGQALESLLSFLGTRQPS